MTDIADVLDGHTFPFNGGWRTIRKGIGDTFIVEYGQGVKSTNTALEHVLFLLKEDDKPFYIDLRKRFPEEFV